MSLENNISDEKLVELVRTKDKELFSEFITRYEAKLVRYASYLIHDNDRAVDAVQEAFIKTYINLNRFDIKKKFSSWIYRIVHNEVINAIKKHRLEIPLLEEMDFEDQKEVEEAYSRKELANQINQCLDKMPLIYAEPISLHFLEEKSYEEISEILRIPMGTIATRINRAKKILKNICSTGHNQKI